MNLLLSVALHNVLLMNQVEIWWHVCFASAIPGTGSWKKCHGTGENVSLIGALRLRRVDCHRTSERSVTVGVFLAPMNHVPAVVRAIVGDNLKVHHATAVRAAIEADAFGIAADADISH